MLPLARCSMCGGAPSEGEHEAPVGVPTCVSGRALLARHEGDPGGVESVVPGRSDSAFGKERGRAGEGEVEGFACAGFVLRLSVGVMFRLGGDDDSGEAVVILPSLHNWCCVQVGW